MVSLFEVDLNSTSHDAMVTTYIDGIKHLAIFCNVFSVGQNIVCFVVSFVIGTSARPCSMNFFFSESVYNLKFIDSKIDTLISSRISVSVSKFPYACFSVSFTNLGIKYPMLILNCDLSCDIFISRSSQKLASSSSLRHRSWCI